MKKIILIIACAITTSTYAQVPVDSAIILQSPSWGNDGWSTWCGDTLFPKDQVLKKNRRFGHLQQGIYGDGWGTWSTIGLSNLGFAPRRKDYYGYSVNHSSDKVFFGLKGVGTATAHGQGDTANAVIAWGDDEMRLIFEWHNNDAYSVHCSDSLREIATMTKRGRMGIGTSRTNLPAARFHVDLTTNLIGNTTNNGIRFVGLPVQKYDTVLVIDPSGNLAKRVYPNGSGSNPLTCSNPYYLPKLDALGTSLVCSQVFDDGTGVGIGSIGPFGYTSLAGALFSGTIPPTIPGNFMLDVAGVARAVAYFATSDVRYKKEINSINDALNIINKLDGKTYFWRTDEFKEKNFSASKQYGFIAQELEQIIPEVVATDAKGYKSVNYDMVVPILVQAIKEQQKQIDDMRTGQNKTGNATGLNQVNSVADGFALDQNVPNPFSQETVIKYTLPQQIKTASLIVYDLSGKQLTSLSLDTNASSITITADKLAAGIYIYSVMADGKIMDSKRMVVADKQ